MLKEEDTPINQFNKMAEYLHTACAPLFNTTFITNKEFKKLQGLRECEFGFWGSGSAKQKDTLFPLDPANILDTTRFSRVWESMLFHHCLLSTYDKLNDLLFQDTKLSSYYFARYLGHCGFDYCYDAREFSLSLNAAKTGFNIISRSFKGTNGSAIASSLGRNSYPQSLETLKNFLNTYEKFSPISDKIVLTHDNKQKCINAEIPLNLVPLIQQLRGRGKELANIFKLYRNKLPCSASAIEKCIKSISEIQKQPIKPTKEESKPNLTKLDRLFYGYKLEQFFHFDLAYCITKNIQELDKRLEQKLREDTAFIELVTSIANFPNTVSRSLLLQMAFDSFSDQRNMRESFLKKRTSSLADSIAYIIKDKINVTDQHNLLNEWIDCYNDFVNYMTDLVFPIYESYFFVMVYDYFVDPNKTDFENLLEIYEKLEVYLSDDSIYNEIRAEYYIDTTINIYNKDAKPDKKFSKKDFILPDYSNKNIDYSTYSKVVLSIYNHMPQDIPPLISRDYLYQKFKRVKECLLTSCTSELLSKP